MGYIGNQPSNNFSSIDKQVITGNGGANYTLTHTVANANEIEVFVNNVRQEAGVAYTVANNALNMTGNVLSTDDFYVIYQGKALQTTVPPDGSVTTAKIVGNAVTSDKLADSAVTAAKLGTGVFNGISHLDIYYFDRFETISGAFEYLEHWFSMDGVKNFNRIGASMTTTNGPSSTGAEKFAFPVTGTWRVVSDLSCYGMFDTRYIQHEIRLSTDSGSNFDTYDLYDNIPYLQSANTFIQSYRERFINVTNTSTFRVAIGLAGGTSFYLQGNSGNSKHVSRLTFMRIGDAQ